jgi:bacillithiol biosynthesis cysteine-adding enzyme BshC
MTIIDHDLIGASSTVGDFLTSRGPISDRFPHREVTPELCQKRALQGASRSRLRHLVELSMMPMELSERQRTSLDVLGAPGSVVVATGQQIGMMGGPMYTLYKIRTAVAEARRISATLGVPAVAVFWLEDNDHDAAEASALTLPGADAQPTSVATWESDGRRMPVSMRLCDTIMQEQVGQAADMLMGPHEATTRERVRTCWTAGTPWGDAFLQMLAPYLRHWGVLVVRASEVITSGMHQPLVEMEVESRTITTALVQGAEVCQRNGLQLQAAVPGFGFFVIDNNERRRPQPDEPGLGEHVRSRPEDFSPSVLSRPLVQDAILPTVINVLGAAELAYHAQLAEAYQACGIEQPVPVLRHGATLLTSKIQRLLAKAETTATRFIREWASIERELADALTHDMFPDAQSRSATIESLLAPYRAAAERTDSTLIATVEAQRTAISASVEALEGKIRAAAKRRNVAIVDRARTIHAALMPNNTLQERVYPLAYWEAQTGIEGLISALETFDAVGAGRHGLIELPSAHGSL